MESEHSDEEIEYAARVFFEDAISIWNSGSSLATPDMPMAVHFELMNKNLRIIARAKGSEAYIPLLEDAVKLAEQQYLAGDERPATKTMVKLLDLIQVHLNLPSNEDIERWMTEGKA